MLAQGPARIRRIGLLSAHSASSTASWHQAFRGGLTDLGWTEGKNIAIEYRYAEGRSERAHDLATELVKLKVDIIVASVTPDAIAAQRATRTIPIVIVAAGDAVAMGLVESLARPGGNVTGLVPMSMETSGKRLELLKEMIPGLARVAVLRNPDNAAAPMSWKEIELPARQLGLRVHSLEVRSPDDFGKAFDLAVGARAGALFIVPDPVITPHLTRLAVLAEKNRLPSIFHISDFPDAGGLLSYGPDRADMFRRAATYVDKILKGARPADLPVERPTKFELVVNLKTARALGLTVPQNLLFRADRVIE